MFFNFKIEDYAYLKFNRNKEVQDLFTQLEQSDYTFHLTGQRFFCKQRNIFEKSWPNYDQLDYVLFVSGDFIPLSIKQMKIDSKNKGKKRINTTGWHTVNDTKTDPRIIVPPLWKHLEPFGFIDVLQPTDTFTKAVFQKQLSTGITMTIKSVELTKLREQIQYYLWYHNKDSIITHTLQTKSDTNRNVIDICNTLLKTAVLSTKNMPYGE